MAPLPPARSAWGVGKGNMAWQYGTRGEEALGAPRPTAGRPGIVSSRRRTYMPHRFLLAQPAACMTGAAELELACSSVPSDIFFFAKSVSFDVPDA